MTKDCKHVNLAEVAYLFRREDSLLLSPRSLKHATGLPIFVADHSDVAASARCPH